MVLSTDKYEPQLSCRTVPKVDAQGLSLRQGDGAKGTPLLPGQVYLFRDGTFVGTGSLPLLAPGEEHELGFGVDDQVKVRHAMLEEKRGESGLISTSRTDSRNYRVTVKNMHERADRPRGHRPGAGLAQSGDQGRVHGPHAAGQDQPRRTSAA